ncbi:MAG TPA: hypothetical protein VME68_12640 [Acidobacteriaceae bacterium]|nr:hypothetical protein [Acidobacteriaceae bacterium]
MALEPTNTLPSPASRRWYRRPCAFGLLGLSLAVVLWGLGYKLSLYHQHANAGLRTPVAKLWVTHRDAGLALAARVWAHRVPAAPALAVCCAFPRPSSIATAPGGLTTPAPVSSRIALPPRSPPPPLRFA